MGGLAMVGLAMGGLAMVGFGCGLSACGGIISRAALSGWALTGCCSFRWGCWTASSSAWLHAHCPTGLIGLDRTALRSTGALPTNSTRDERSGRPACTALTRTVLVRSALVGGESRLGQGVDSGALLAARNIEATPAACGFASSWLATVGLTTAGLTTIGFTTVGRWSEIHVSVTLLSGTARADDRFTRSTIVWTSDFRAGPA